MHRASRVYGDAGQDCHGLLQSQAKNIEQFGPVTVPRDAAARVSSGRKSAYAAAAVLQKAGLEDAGWGRYYDRRLRLFAAERKK